MASPSRHSLFAVHKSRKWHGTDQSARSDDVCSGEDRKLSAHRQTDAFDPYRKSRRPMKAEISFRAGSGITF